MEAGQFSRELGENKAEMIDTAVKSRRGGHHSKRAVICYERRNAATHHRHQCNEQA